MHFARRRFASVLALSVSLTAFAPISGCGPKGGADATATAGAALAPLDVSGARVAWDVKTGLSIESGGVTVVHGSFFRLTDPAGVALLDPASVAPTISAWKADGDKKTAEIVFENAAARVSHSISVTDGGVVSTALSWRTKGNLSGRLEYAAALLDGPALSGARLSGQNGGVPIPPGTIRVNAPRPGRTPDENRIAPSFTRLSVSTRLGEIEIGASGPGVALYDARSETAAWARDYPLFRLGVGAPSIAVESDGVERRAIFTFRITPGKTLASAARVSVAAPGGSSTVARAAAPPARPVPVGLPLLIPRPKKITATDAAPFALTDAVKIVVADNATVEEKRGAVLLQDEIASRYGLKLELVPSSRRESGPAIAFSGPLSSALTAPNRPEGYAVSVGASGVAVAGHDAAGLLWGAQTLIQLLDKTPSVRAARIDDWPTLSTRGVHLFHGKDAPAFQKKLIDRVLSRFKMNTIFLQAERSVWDHDPSVAPSFAATKAQLKDQIEYARARGIMTIPLFQSYGHLEWLLSGEKNRNLAEDPQTPYALNFSDPKAVAYLEGFLSEMDTLFAAPGFHAGLDEVAMRGRFPFQTKGGSFSKMVPAAANHWSDFFKKRGKTLYLWADQALYPGDVSPSFGTAPTPGDATAVRAAYPKDAVLIDWQYGEHDRFPSLKKLRDAGFSKVMAATWFKPKNIQNFSRAAAKVGAVGAVQTTWCGYESTESVLKTEHRKQFTAMVLAADYFWNGGEGPSPDALPYQPGPIFDNQWGAQSPLKTVGPGKAAAPADTAPAASSVIAAASPTNPAPPSGATRLYDLSSSATVSLSNFLEFGRDNSPSGTPPSSGAPLADGVRYRFSSGAILLAARLNPGGRTYPELVELAAPRGEVGEIRLALASSHTAKSGATIGSVVLSFTDGSSETVPLVYGKNIASWDDENRLDGATILWHGRTPVGGSLIVRSLAICPKKAGPLSSVRVVSGKGAAAPILFAATIVERG